MTPMGVERFEVCYICSRVAICASLTTEIRIKITVMKFLMLVIQLKSAPHCKSYRRRYIQVIINRQLK